ncbi:MAG: hypothetical protein JW955_15650 [Sedimentisphaerales bacterium]|nr:hypothetical protein [Sedimentisphaerales bacterium]
MKKRLLVVVVLCGLLATGLAGIALANGALESDTPAIMVSPNTIVLAKVSTVSVHTNIPAAAVVPGSLDLDGVAPTSVYVDNLGHIAAKFAVVDLDLSPGPVTLTLSGDLTDGTCFSASDVVTVK